jgi:hypothetical protein
MPERFARIAALALVVALILALPLLFSLFATLPTRTPTRTPTLQIAFASPTAAPVTPPYEHAAADADAFAQSHAGMPQPRDARTVVGGPGRFADGFAYAKYFGHAGTRTRDLHFQ